MKASFDCEACDGHLFTLTYDDDERFLIYDNGWRKTRVPGYALEAVKFAMEQRNARLLYGIDEDYVRGYCTSCDKLYCSNHGTDTRSSRRMDGVTASYGPARRGTAGRSDSSQNIRYQ